MTVRLIGPDGTGRTVYVPNAQSEDSAILQAQALHGARWLAAWVLPGHVS